VCGRFVSPGQAAIERHWILPHGENPFAARYNVSPMTAVPVIRMGDDGRLELVTLQWWLVPHWSQEPRVKFSTFNARVDRVASAASYRVPFRKRRCLIPALGWYEWQETPDGKRKWFYHRPDNGIVALAGLWDRWHRGEEVLESCTLLVGEANQSMMPVHDRMPVVIERRDETFWLDRGISEVTALQTLLHPPAEDAITAHPVRNERRARDDDPALIDPLE
jgi:putative SOS response-associated peptidase YedK